MRNNEKESWKQSLDEISQKIFKLLSDNKQSHTESNRERKYRLTKTGEKDKRTSHNSSILHELHLDENKKKYLNIDELMNFKTYDFHELYVKTFHACDGDRYIFYNHEKHMKGLSQMRTYNNFIRKNKKTGDKEKDSCEKRYKS